MTISEFDTYINTSDVVLTNNINDVEDAIDVAEDAITDDAKFPVIKDNKIKKCCQMTLELIKVFINYIKLI